MLLYLLTGIRQEYCTASQLMAYCSVSQIVYCLSVLCFDGIQCTVIYSQQQLEASAIGLSVSMSLSRIDAFFNKRSANRIS